jgi:hypothetical protein
MSPRKYRKILYGGITFMILMLLWTSTLIIDHSFHFMFPPPKLGEENWDRLALIISYVNVLQCLWYLRIFTRRLRVINRMIKTEKERKIKSINEYFSNRDQLKPPSDTEIRTTYRKRLQNNKP